jgi:hypothetical protein
MDVKSRILNHYKRWNIGFDSEQAFIKFRNRVVAVIQAYFPIMQTNVSNKFAYLYGCNVHVGMYADISKNLSDSYAYTNISRTKTVKDLATALQCFFIAL